jgi:hypothetical protein
MDNRIIPKWDTNLKEKRDNYIFMREKTDSMNRQIAHYDEELKEARKCINDINELVSDLNKKDLINGIKEIIIKYCNSSRNYSDVNVKCLIKGSTVDDDDIQLSSNAERVILQPMEDYV